MNPGRLRTTVEYGAYASVRAILSLLGDRSAAAFGAGLGRAASLLSGRRDRLAKTNLALAFPEWDEATCAATTRRCWAHFGRVAVDYLRYDSLTPEGLLARIAVEGEENFRAARARGKGVFLLSAHLGHWEVGALAAGILGGPISIVVRPLDNPRLEEELRHHRERHGNRVISKREAAREMLKAMRGGETVAILVDQKVAPDEGVAVPFFGRPALTTPALAKLAARTDSAVVPVFCRPDDERGPGRYRLVFEPAIVPSELPERERTTEALTARFMAVTEAAIRVRPELWLWMHDRWRFGRAGR